MPIYTIISEVADDMHATQHEVNRPCNAICDHIASRGLDPLFEFSDDQVTQLQRFFGKLRTSNYWICQAYPIHGSGVQISNFQISLNPFGLCG